MCFISAGVCRLEGSERCKVVAIFFVQAVNRCLGCQEAQLTEGAVQAVVRGVSDLAATGVAAAARFGEETAGCLGHIVIVTRESGPQLVATSPVLPESGGQDPAVPRDASPW